MSTKRTQGLWELRESGPTDAKHTVLLLPGGLCSGEFFEDVMAEPALASVRLVAATVPGFGRTTPPDDMSMESYATLAGKLAADLGCDVVAGHSYGGNIALEMGATGTFSGPIVLLSPTFSAQDEMKPLEGLTKLGRVPLVGALAWWAALKVVPAGSKKELPEARRDVLAADMGNTDPGTCRRMMRPYFAYLERYAEVATRLCESGVKAWVVRGDKDQIGLTDDERKILETCPTVTMVTIPDATHMLLVEQPAKTADVILAATAAV